MMLLSLISAIILASTAGLVQVGATCMTCPDAEPASPNTWVAWRGNVSLKAVPRDAHFRISCDSKYWLWVNGEQVVFEGGLKRGPNATDSYYDEIDLRPWLRKGTNRIAVLQWHFGKSGFSHNDSGHASMWIDCPGLIDPSAWRCRIHPAYLTCGDPFPNYRLSESNIRFDERENLRAGMADWVVSDAMLASQSDTPSGSLLGSAASSRPGSIPDTPSGWTRPIALEGSPLGSLRPRPVPMWKNYGVCDVDWTIRNGSDCDTLYADLPYNMQLTPIVELRDIRGGNIVKLETDHAYHGRAHCVRAEYVTAPGTHAYESLGWMNGEHLLAIVPHGVVVTRLAYRETGYDCDFSGTFECDDEFYMKFWEKALRTLYVNMRDNFFDCPDRERAQWWGDIVTLQGEAFYTCSRSVDALVEKGIRQLCEYQRPDSTLHSPIPGCYNKELPAQMLSSVGYYGFWTYYLNTGDRAALEFFYPYVRRYLGVWKTDSTGLTAMRKGEWSWGDWGKNVDIRLVLGAWHYMALHGAALMADELGLRDDAFEYRAVMEKVRAGYNACWDGTAYRHPDYAKATDDRVQALAVVAGIAPEEYWPQITEFLKRVRHASPYLEKYVMEALFKMGEGEYAMTRCAERFDAMVRDSLRTTLYEGWAVGSKEFGGGTSNHAWSGGALTVIASELCGIRPLSPGWKTFTIAPAPVRFGSCSISIPTVRGVVSSSFAADGSSWTITIPKGTRATIVDPWSKATFTKGPGTYRLR